MERVLSRFLDKADCKVNFVHVGTFSPLRRAFFYLAFRHQLALQSYQAEGSAPVTESPPWSGLFVA